MPPVAAKFSIKSQCSERIVTAVSFSPFSFPALAHERKRPRQLLRSAKPGIDYGVSMVTAV